jgi:hypothetical protein
MHFRAAERFAKGVTTFKEKRVALWTKARRAPHMRAIHVTMFNQTVAWHLNFGLLCHQQHALAVLVNNKRHRAYDKRTDSVRRTSGGNYGGNQ